MFKCTRKEVLRNLNVTVECIEDKGKKEVKASRKIPGMGFGYICTMFVSTYMYCSKYQ